MLETYEIEINFSAEFQDYLLFLCKVITVDKQCIVLQICSPYSKHIPISHTQTSEMRYVHRPYRPSNFLLYLIAHVFTGLAPI